MCLCPHIYRITTDTDLIYMFSLITCSNLSFTTIPHLDKMTFIYVYKNKKYTISPMKFTKHLFRNIFVENVITHQILVSNNESYEHNFTKTFILPLALFSDAPSIIIQYYNIIHC